MHYEINVAKRNAKPGFDGKPTYSHFFATAERSITNEEKLREVYSMLRLTCPEPAFQITITRVETTGAFVDPATLL
jgi:hypothetical protein